jgi:hypothetical protein
MSTHALVHSPMYVPVRLARMGWVRQGPGGTFGKCCRTEATAKRTVATTATEDACKEECHRLCVCRPGSPMSAQVSVLLRKTIPPMRWEGAGQGADDT